MVTLHFISFLHGHGFQRLLSSPLRVTCPRRELLIGLVAMHFLSRCRSMRTFKYDKGVRLNVLEISGTRLFLLEEKVSTVVRKQSS